MVVARFMLQLRGHYYSDPSLNSSTDDSDMSQTVSTVRFRMSSVVGNLGATLEFEIQEGVSGRAFGDIEEISEVHSSDVGEEERVEGQHEHWQEWYEDDKPLYSDDPFRTGMTLRHGQIAAGRSRQNEGP